MRLLFKFYTMLVLILFASLLIGYAASCNARMDTVKDHWSISIYKDDDPQWYNPAVSWTNKTNPAAIALQRKYLPWYVRWIADIKPDWDPISDYWHFEKSKCLLSLFFATGAAWIAGGYATAFDLVEILFFALSFVVFCGLAWIVTFDYFYNRQLVTSPNKKPWLWLRTP